MRFQSKIHLSPIEWYWPCPRTDIMTSSKSTRCILCILDSALVAVQSRHHVVGLRLRPLLHFSHHLAQGQRVTAAHGGPVVTDTALDLVPLPDSNSQGKCGSRQNGETKTLPKLMGQAQVQTARHHCSNNTYVPVTADVKKPSAPVSSSLCDHGDGRCGDAQSRLTQDRINISPPVALLSARVKLCHLLVLKVCGQGLGQ